MKLNLTLLVLFRSATAIGTCLIHLKEGKFSLCDILDPIFNINGNICGKINGWIGGYFCFNVDLGKSAELALFSTVADCQHGAGRTLLQIRHSARVLHKCNLLLFL